MAETCRVFNDVFTKHFKQFLVFHHVGVKACQTEVHELVLNTVNFTQKLLKKSKHTF
jgi:hypothetical protein